MSVLVIAAARFIGRNSDFALNRSRVTDIIAVDKLTRSEKFVNLAAEKISDYIDKNDFIERVRAGTAPIPEAIFHQGACSDIMEMDGRYMMENNYRYTLTFFEWSQKLHSLFIYASSVATYGASRVFVEGVKHEGPLNVYGYSIQKEGKLHLFEGCLDYGNGCQMRDFVYVDDGVNEAMHFLSPEKSGIFNCGTGRAQPFNDIALTVVNSLSGTDYSLEDAVAKGLIECVDFPPTLKGKYQAFTQADFTNLRENGGYKENFGTVQHGIASNMEYLKQEQPANAT